MRVFLALTVWSRRERRPSSRASVDIDDAELKSINSGEYAQTSEEGGRRSRPSSRASKQDQVAQRRVRREVANFNERRRMQNINTGFDILKSLLPHYEGEKLSKVGHRQLEQDMTDLAPGHDSPASG